MLKYTIVYEQGDTIMMKRLFMTVCVCAMTAAMFCGCSKEEPVEEKEDVVLVIDEPEEETEPVIITNPITGEVSETEIKGRPLIVSYDNVGSAIPQSWTSMADIVYEFPVEGSQTRLNAVFYSEFPEFLGPIRSTRPYFVDLTREYKGVFLAHGWSPQAKQYLTSNVVPYINAMNSDAKFYRVSDKSAPHNSYIKWSEVENQIEKNGWWEEKQDIRSFTFLAEGEKNEGAAVNFVEFDSAAHCEFTYDAEKNHYVRTINNGSKYVDKETGEPVTVNNVLVQKVSSKTLDEKGRLEINMCAGGEALLFTNGVVVEGTWSRDDLDSRTIFKDANRNEFKLSVGNSWVMVADQNTKISYEVPEEAAAE